MLNPLVGFDVRKCRYDTGTPVTRGVCGRAPPGCARQGPPAHAYHGRLPRDQAPFADFWLVVVFVEVFVRIIEFLRVNKVFNDIRPVSN